MERALTIKVAFQDAKGKAKTKKFRDWEARIFQHEYDHLDGVVYIDRLSPEGREKVCVYVCVLGVWGSERDLNRVRRSDRSTPDINKHKNKRCSPCWTSSSRTLGPAGRCDWGIGARPDRGWSRSSGGSGDKRRAFWTRTAVFSRFFWCCFPSIVFGSWKHLGE